MNLCFFKRKQVSHLGQPHGVQKTDVDKGRLTFSILVGNVLLDAGFTSTDTRVPTRSFPIV